MGLNISGIFLITSGIFVIISGIFLITSGILTIGFSSGGSGGVGRDGGVEGGITAPAPLKVDSLASLVQSVETPSPFLALTLRVKLVLAESPEDAQEVSVIQPELVPAVVFSIKYSVPEGLELADQEAVIWEVESAVKDKEAGTLAKVKKVNSLPEPVPTLFLVWALK